MAKSKSTASAVRDDPGAAVAILEKYLSELKVIRSTGAGVPETSYYPALSELFNTIGKTLKPKVRCVINLSNQGAGIPDGGLFTADQFQRQSDGAPKAGQLPSRGAIEAKGTKPETTKIAESKQVTEYLKTYGIVIVTNLREFLIVERGQNGQPGERESYRLADNERDFWQHKAAHPRATAQQQGAMFVEFLNRACLHATPLTNPKDVAWFLASYARDALFRVEQKKELPALQSVRSALEEALGMKFTDDKGEHFFRSTLVQTLFYGVFSAWVRWHRDNPAANARFDWRTAEWSLHVPFVRALYEEVAKPSRLGPLGLVEVLNWAAAVLNRVVRGEFFSKFEDEHAVQYFYEPFLEAYDPELRKELGVWYTPPEIVKYQVARVDRVLRDELDLPDGLADPNVIVLDPCCGTGAYLVEVLRQIERNIRAKHDDALIGHDVKRAAMERVFGFEIMPAPFVVAHLQIGLLLQQIGLPLSPHTPERIGVFLTNALTGWEPPQGPKQQVMSWAELQEERDAAENVKRDKKILVVLGNPPYNGFAGVAVEEERSLTTAYRTTKKAPAPEGQGLNDLYVRFFRMAEHRIAEMSGEGIVSFISNYSWLDGRSHSGMRERFLEAFDDIWIDCLNGDKYKTGKTTPQGKPDPSVFSTSHNREGIQVGTAIALLVRKEKHCDGATVLFRHFWGAAKLSEILEAAREETPTRYEPVVPHSTTGFPLVPSLATDAYFCWPRVTELLPVSFPGIKTSRDDLVVDIDRESLERRISAYFHPAVTHDEMATICPTAVRDASRFEAKPTRDYLRNRGVAPNGIRRYQYRPFDLRWLYWEPETKLLDEKRSDYVSQWSEGSLWLCAVQQNRKDFNPPAVSSHLCSLHLIERGANLFPLSLTAANSDSQLFTSEHTILNLSPSAAKFLTSLGGTDPEKSARLLFFHIIATSFAPEYRTENAAPLRQDWPRIALPASRIALESSAALGEQIAALLDTETDVPGVTSGNIAPVCKSIGAIRKVGGGDLDPNGRDFAVTAGWGHNNNGATMPGKGSLTERNYDDAETKAIEAEGAVRGMTAKDVTRLLGDKTCDVYLNGVAYWRNIPSNAWKYYIGGYQVIKKWLSYRELPLLGRPLKPDEAREVTNMARRIAAIALLQPKLDENYRAVKAAAFDWSSL